MDRTPRFNPDELGKRAPHDVFRAQAKRFIEDTKFTEAPPRTPDSQLPGKKREEIELKTGLKTVEERLQEELKIAEERLQEAQEKLKEAQNKLEKYINGCRYLEKRIKKRDELKKSLGNSTSDPEMKLLQEKIKKKRYTLEEVDPISLIQNAKHKIHWIKELYEHKSTRDENDNEILKELEETERYLSSTDLKKELRRYKASIYEVSIRAVIMVDTAEDLGIDVKEILKKNDWKKFIVDIATEKYPIPELATIEETSLNRQFIYKMIYDMHEKDNTISDEQRQSEEYEKIVRIVFKSYPDYKKLKST